MGVLTTTERLVIREITVDDAAHIQQLNADPEVLRYVHDVPFADVDAARKWITEIPHTLPNGFGRWSITLKDGTWIGRCSLRKGDDGTTLMGYRLLREHWGQGYASETVRALLEQAYLVYGLPFVLSHIAEENRGSIRVAEKCGAILWKRGATVRCDDALIYRYERPIVI